MNNEEEVVRDSADKCPEIRDLVTLIGDMTKNILDCEGVIAKYGIEYKPKHNPASFKIIPYSGGFHHVTLYSSGKPIITVQTCSFSPVYPLISINLNLLSEIGQPLGDMCICVNTMKPLCEHAKSIAKVSVESVVACSGLKNLLEGFRGKDGVLSC